jgi:hypothetical protein
MVVRAIIEEVRKAGLRIGLRNSQIAVNPITLLSDNLRAQIRGSSDGITLAIKNAPGRLVELAIHAGIHEQGSQFSPSDIRRLADNEDLQDVVNSTGQELQAWASALAIRAVRYRGKVPRGWDQVAHCAQCGPVYSFAAGEYLSCAWCDLQRAGKWFPVPNEEDL